MAKPISRYEFGPFVLDVTRRVLLRAGEPVALAPKALEMLLAFAERPQQVLTKREIMQRVWPDTFVEEANVAQNISLLRKVLPELIVTVPRTGYQFAAAVRAIPLGAGDETEPVLDARNVYLRGRHYWNKRTADGLRKALGCAVHALEADPASIRGHLALADTYNLLGGQHGVLAPREAFPRARAAAYRALEVDGNCGKAYASLAFVAAWYDWDYDQAERQFSQAIELEPGYATAYHWWAEALACAGRFGESFTHYETAMALDPLSSAIRTDYAGALSLAGDSSECERTIAEVLRFDPAFVRGPVILAMNAERVGNYKRAREIALRALQQERSPAMLALLARVSAAAGLRGEARSVLEQLELLQTSEHVVRSDLAGVHAALGDFDRAESLIERSFALREPHVSWLIHDPAFATMRERTDLVRHWTENARAWT